ncbi:MAG: LysR family transcriptional regulator [Stenotrophomonas sp.]|nr:LysR family transcriptional regulator [Stenotrophomonas sp.]
MQLKALRYFLMVASSGSFLATARHYQVPASSVSRHVAALEKDLGRQLLYRSTRAVSLTEEGERFLAQAREAIELLDQAADEIGGSSGDIRGLVRINAPEAFGRLHVADAVHALQDRHPGLSVELTLTDAFIDPVQEAADIIIRIGVPVDSGLIGHVIPGNTQRLLASPGYLAQHGAPAVPADLLQHHCLVYKGQLGAQRWYFQRAGEGPVETINVSGPLRSNNAEVLLAAALKGRGIVLFPTWLLDPGTLQRRELVALLPQWSASAMAEQAQIQLLSPQSRLRSRKIREVTAFLQQWLGTRPYADPTPWEQ